MTCSDSWVGVVLSFVIIIALKLQAIQYYSVTIQKTTITIFIATKTSIFLLLRCRYPDLTHVRPRTEIYPQTSHQIANICQFPAFRLGTTLPLCSVPISTKEWGQSCSEVCSLQRTFWAVQTGAVRSPGWPHPANSTSCDGMPLSEIVAVTHFHTAGGGGGYVSPQLFHYFYCLILFICLLSTYPSIQSGNETWQQCYVRLGEVNRALALGYPPSSIARGVHFPSGSQSAAVKPSLSFVHHSLCWHIPFLGFSNLGLQCIFSTRRPTAKTITARLRCYNVP